MELLGLLLSVLTIAFVIAKVIFRGKANTLVSTDPPKEKSDEI